MKIKSIKNVGRRNVYDLSVKEVEHYVLENGVVTHNTGIYYSSNNIFVIGRAQVKEGKEVVGYDFNINIEKSRGAKEKTKLPFTVTFEGGVNKYAGLFDVAKDLGFINMPTSGYYTRVIKGTEEDKKWRRKEIEYSDEWWEPIISDPAFDRAIQNKYKLVHNNDIEDDIDLSEEV